MASGPGTMFSQAIGLGAKQSKSRQSARSTLTEGAANVKEWGFDKMEDIKAKLEEAAQEFSTYNTLAGLGTTILGLMLAPVNPIAAAAILGGTRYKLGRMAEGRAADVLGRGATARWGQGSVGDMKGQFKTATNKASLMTAAIAGATAVAAGRGMKGTQSTTDASGKVTKGIQATDPVPGNMKGATFTQPVQDPVTGQFPRSWDTPRVTDPNILQEGGWIDRSFGMNIRALGKGYGKSVERGGGVFNPYQYGKAAYKGFAGTSGLFSGALTGGKTMWEMYQGYPQDED